MEIAFWVVGIWFALSLVAAPLIAVLGRANDAPTPARGYGPPTSGN